MADPRRQRLGPILETATSSSVVVYHTGGGLKPERGVYFWSLG